MKIAGEERDKTTFTSHHGLFRFARMPFRLRNAPETCQSGMDILMSLVKWLFALVSLENIVIFSSRPEQHIAHIRIKLNLWKQVGVTLNLKKCSFFTDNIVYLGHIIWPGRLEIALHLTEVINWLKSPTIVTALKPFLDLCSVQRPLFPDIAEPLHR